LAGKSFAKFMAFYNRNVAVLPEVSVQIQAGKPTILNAVFAV